MWARGFYIQASCSSNIKATNTEFLCKNSVIQSLWVPFESPWVLQQIKDILAEELEIKHWRDLIANLRQRSEDKNKNEQFECSVMEII